MGTPTRFRCNVCDQTEQKCTCEKYCAFCQASLEVRLCEDGLYYCPSCREACEMVPEN
jgi:hypothetical protein